MSLSLDLLDAPVAAGFPDIPREPIGSGSL